MTQIADDQDGASDNLTRLVALERHGWERRASTYDRGFGLLAAGAHAALLDVVGARHSIRLLEVGCGTGQLTRAAVLRGATVVATDAATNMTTVASGAVPEAQMVCAALPMLPFDDGVFDAAVGAFVLNHVPDPRAAIGELARVTKGGGVIALSCWDSGDRNRAQGVIFDALDVVEGSKRATVSVDSPFAAHATEAGFAELMRYSGLHEVAVVRVTWTHRVDPERWWQDVLTGTVLTSARIEGLPPETYRRVRRAYHDFVGKYQGDERTVELPASALLAVGTV